jgi:hypothetical protein
MATAEHREPCDSRGSRTVLGAPGGEIPPGDSTDSDEPINVYNVCSLRKAGVRLDPSEQPSLPRSCHAPKPARFNTSHFQGVVLIAANLQMRSPASVRPFSLLSHTRGARRSSGPSFR